MTLHCYSCGNPHNSKIQHVLKLFFSFSHLRWTCVQQTVAGEHKEMCFLGVCICAYHLLLLLLICLATMCILSSFLLPRTSTLWSSLLILAWPVTLSLHLFCLIFSIFSPVHSSPLCLLPAQTPGVSVAVECVSPDTWETNRPAPSILTTSLPKIKLRTQPVATEH